MRTSRGFTLLELLVTMAVIALVASMVLFAMSHAQQSASESKTKSTIMKLHDIVARRWDEYRYKRVPAPTTLRRLVSGNLVVYAMDPAAASQFRLAVLRDIMRQEMPDRWEDVLEAPLANYQRTFSDGFQEGYNVPNSALRDSYIRYYNTVSIGKTSFNRPSRAYESAECLYMMVKLAAMDEGDGLAAFAENEIGDFDNDGANEFIDAWGMPIQFLRWPVGFVNDRRFDTGNDTFPFGHLSDLQPIKDEVTCVPDAGTYHDPFDPMKVETNAYWVFPLIYSAGPDKKYDIYTGLPETVVSDPFANVANNPCANYNPIMPFNPMVVNAGLPKVVGLPRDQIVEPIQDSNNVWIWRDDNNRLNHYDNIHNHLLDASGGRQQGYDKTKAQKPRGT